MAKEKFDLVSEVETENRNSAVYFFVTVIFALIIVELIHFLVRLNPIEGEPYYQIQFQWVLLPQVIALAGSAYILFDFYRKILLLFRETLIRKIVTVVIGFLVLSGIYIFAFANPNYWIFLIGFNLTVYFYKNVPLYLSVRSDLKKAKIEGEPGIYLLGEIKEWVVFTIIYSVLVILVGIVYVFMMEGLEKANLFIARQYANWVAVLVFFLMAGAKYYWTPSRKAEPLLSRERIEKFKRKLEEVYELEKKYKKLKAAER